MNEPSMPNDSEQYRMECEARHVMEMSKEQRQEYYKGVQEKRGRDPMLELFDEVKRQSGKEKTL